MPVGPGKYDDACTAARLATGAGAVALIVLGGNLGAGFSVQGSAELVARLPGAPRDHGNSDPRELGKGRGYRMSAAERRRAYVHTSKTAARSCPACARILDASTGVSIDDADRRPQPKPGDVTACAYCGTILVYAAEGFRLATSEDIDGLPPELRLLVLEFSASRTKAPTQ